MKKNLLILLVALAGTASAQTVLTIPIITGFDDMERRVTGGTPSLDTSSSDLEFGADGGRPNTVGLRFTNAGLTPSSVVTDAYIQFTGDSASDLAADSAPASTSFAIRGEKNVNPVIYSDTVIDDLINRPVTTTSVNWTNVPSWTENARGTNERTPNLTVLVNELIAQSGWTSGNALSFIVAESATSERTAWSYERSISDSQPTFAPTLVITIVTPTDATDWALYQ